MAKHRKQRVNTEGTALPGNKKRGRRRFHELSSENDIRYRGPLSYRWLTILGWLCLALQPIPILVDLGARMNPSVMTMFGTLSFVITSLKSFALPLLLIADFAEIINNRDGYVRRLLSSGTMTIGITAMFYIVFYRYVIGNIEVFSLKPGAVERILHQLFMAFDSRGFIAFNVFIDLFLCNLFAFFLYYRPKKVFTGKKLILFRLMAILPIAYEIASLVVKILASLGYVILPFWVMPLLTIKPPMVIAVFVMIGLFIKIRERRYCRKGRNTLDEYQSFLKTNRNSLHFSVFLSATMVLAGILDFVLMTMLSGILAAFFSGPEFNEELVQIYTKVSFDVGLGGAVMLIPLAPLMLLFSYTREHANRKVDSMIPAAAVVVMIILTVEGVHQGLKIAGFPKYDLEAMVEELQNLSFPSDEGDLDPEGMPSEFYFPLTEEELNSEGTLPDLHFPLTEEELNSEGTLPDLHFPLAEEELNLEGAPDNVGANGSGTDGTGLDAAVPSPGQAP